MPIPCTGGCTFAECPERAAPEARIIWHADLDPGALFAVAVPAARSDRDAIDPDRLVPWLASARRNGTDHIVLSDGWRHLRIDIAGGFDPGHPVVLHWQITGISGLPPRLLTLRRLAALCRHGRFGASLFPRESRMDRWIGLLRVADALNDGASQRDIALAFFGAARVGADLASGSDSLKSRVRRMISEARMMAGGGWRFILRRHERAANERESPYHSS